LFAITPRVTIAGVVATLGGFVNLWVYNGLKRRFARTNQITGLRATLSLLYRGNISAAAGEFVNTVLFIGIAFWGILPNLAEAILGGWVVKVAVGFFGMPVLAAGRRLIQWRQRSDPVTAFSS
jgi:uncharacterized PurR-regulated membrane protein YhhQ (DUF165 family)